MTDKQPPEEDLSEEFHNLGKNLTQAFRVAWDHPERKRMQEEVVKGLNDLGSTLKREADAFAESSAAQQIKTNVEDIGERIRSTDAQSKVRHELISALQTANTELQKIVDKLARASRPEAEPESTQPEKPGKSG